MKNKPAYSIESVDRALHLAALLQQEGPVRVTDAARVLGVSASGAHRLLSMLVYRDFAEQLPDRRYSVGPILRAAEKSDAPIHLLRQLGPPHLRELVAKVNESANLVIRVGTETRFISTVETDRALRVGDRSGQTLPAHLSSGGKALLATLSPTELAALYGGSDVDPRKLHRNLHRVRTDGYAINRGDTEEGVTAIGMAVPGANGQPACAISVALPSTRLKPAMVPTFVAAIATARTKLAADLQQHGS